MYASSLIHVCYIYLILWIMESGLVVNALASHLQSWRFDSCHGPVWVEFGCSWHVQSVWSVWMGVWLCLVMDWHPVQVVPWMVGWNFRLLDLIFYCKIVQRQSLCSWIVYKSERICLDVLIIDHKKYSVEMHRNICDCNSVWENNKLYI